MAINLTIVDADISDIPGIVACGERFFEYAQYSKFGMPLDKPSFANTMIRFLNSGNAKCLLAKREGEVKGGICGIIHPWEFNSAILVAREFFYWMDEDVRGTVSIRMFKQYEDWAKERGAKNTMVQPETHLTEKVGRLYKIKGYVPFERMWVKQ